MIIIIAILIVGLNAGDYFTTMAILSNGGRECNPVMKWIIDHNLFVPAKIILIGAAVAGLLWIRTTNPITAAIAGWMIVAWYVWVVWHNLQQLAIAKGR